MAKLKLVWENNPDTPLSASNLSKGIREYDETNLLYIDNDGFIENADNQLKLRANSRIAINTNNTIAFFNFNDSLISHDSKLSATTAANINFRKETPFGIGKSIALETQTTNKAINSDFSDDLNNWTQHTEGNANISIMSEGLYGDNCAVLSLVDTNPVASISQKIQFESTASDSDNPNISLSFYYKSDGELNVLITGKPDSPQPVYWNNTPSGLRWEVQPEAAIISLSPSSDWTRVEIKNVRTDTLFPDNNINLKIYSSQENTTHYIDAIQAEEKEFCSSFTTDVRGESILKYSHNVIRIQRGSIDIEFLPKKINTEKNIIFRLGMNPQFNSTLNETFNDAMRFELNSVASTVSFSVYDTVTQTEKQLSRTMSSIAFADMIDKWQRIIISWDEEEPFIKFSFNGDTPNIFSQDFTLINVSEVSDLELGGNGVWKFEGLMSSIKFNIFPKTSDEMILESTEIPAPDNNEYKLFEVQNESIVVNNDVLDTGTIQPSTEYYIYLTDCEGIEEEIEIIVSQSNINPLGKNRFFSHIIAGFKTDSESKPINSSLWDKKTKQFPTIMAERFIINGEDSETNNIEFRTTPYGDVNDAKFNIPTYFTDHIYGVTGGTNFFDVDPTGLIKIDNLKIDNNTIESINNNNLILSTSSTNKIIIEAGNIDINTMGGNIQLDDIRIQGRQLSVASGTNITLSNDTNASEIIINSYNGISRIVGDTHINEAVNTNFNGQFVTIQSTDTTQINSGTSPIAIDNITFSGNNVSAKTGSDLHLTSPTQIQIDGPIRINQDQLRFANYNGQKLYLDDTVGKSGLGMQGSSMYFRTANHYMWFRTGIHNDTVGNPGTGGTVLALLTGNDQTREQLGVTLDPYSRFYAGRVHNAVYNDYAECWPKDGQVEYGQVVVRTEKGVVISTKRAQKATIGIVSNTYGHLLGDEGFDPDLKKSKVIPVGLAGRVETSYYKNLEIGDEVVSYKNGQVVKANWIEKIFKRDRIIGIVDSINNNKCWIKVN